MTRQLNADRRSAALGAALAVSYVAVAWSATTGVLSVLVGVNARSTALLGTGADVLADVVSSIVLIWRFRSERAGHPRGSEAEQVAQRVSSSALLLVAIGLAVAATGRLVTDEGAHSSLPAVTLAAASAVGLPLLARWKYRVAAEVRSRALRTDAHITFVGAGTAAITLVGLVVTSELNWSAADPIAALVIAVIAARVGTAGLLKPRPRPPPPDDDSGT